MKNRRWGVASDGIGHQRWFKVINQGHLMKKGDLTKHFGRFVIGIFGKVIYLRVRKMGAWMLPVVEKVDKGHHLRSLAKVIWRAKRDLTRNVKQFLVGLSVWFRGF